LRETKKLESRPQASEPPGRIRTTAAANISINNGEGGWKGEVFEAVQAGGLGVLQEGKKHHCWRETLVFPNGKKKEGDKGQETTS